VRLSAEDLAAAIDALIENVIAHTEEGTPFAVSVRLEHEAGRPMVVVAVSDEGPGLSPGVGVRGRSDRGSTGLGLDIARQAAETSGGELRLVESASGGAQVELWLGTVALPGAQQAHSTT
jgi:signal transduction histidine kinase